MGGIKEHAHSNHHLNNDVPVILEHRCWGNNNSAVIRDCVNAGETLKFADTRACNAVNINMYLVLYQVVIQNNYFSFCF